MEWRVDYIMSSSKLESVDEPTVNLLLKVKDPAQTEAKVTRTEVGMSTFQLLLSELKQAEAAMASVTSE
jgi:hypothetical protein